MSLKKNLLLSMLLLSSRLISCMEIENYESKNELIKKKIKIDCSNTNWGTLAILPDDIKKEILDYILNDFNIENLKTIDDLININNLKTINKIFTKFLLKKHDKQLKKISQILDKQLMRYAGKYNFTRVSHDYLITIKKIIKFSSNLDLQDEDGNTILIFASEWGNKDIVQLLISFNVNLNLKNKDGYTALFMACAQHYKEIIELLIAAGADLNIQNNDRQSVLMELVQKDLDRLKVEFKLERIEIIKLLIKSGADLYLKDNNEKTAFDLSKTDEIRNILKDAMNKK